MVFGRIAEKTESDLQFDVGDPLSPLKSIINMPDQTSPNLSTHALTHYSPLHRVTVLQIAQFSSYRVSLTVPLITTNCHHGVHWRFPIALP